MLGLLAQSPTNIANQNIEILINLSGANFLQFPNKPTSYPFNPKDFQYLEQIFANKQSVVEKYLHTPSEHELAIKFIRIHYDQTNNHHQSALKELQTEIEIHQKLATSGSIVSFYGFCVCGDYILICMELMDMSLRDFYLSLHNAKIAISEEVLWHIIISVIKALEVCKENSIMHRDIKPLNILVNSRGEIKLCDFGVSRILEDSKASTFVGTVAYWPPERFTDYELRYDFRAEIWSLGVTILEFIMGKLPYSQNEENTDIITFQNLIKEYKFTGDKILETYSEDLKSLIESCLKPVSERPKLEKLLDMETYKRQENDSEEYHELIKYAIESKSSSKLRIKSRIHKPISIGIALLALLIFIGLIYAIRVFVVNQPNEVELNGIIKDMVGAEFNLIYSDLIAANIPKIMDWFKEKREQGTFFSDKDGKELFKSTKQQIAKLILVNSTLEYRAKMEKFGIEFTPDIINELQLHNFLTAKDERQIFILGTEYNTLSAIKLSQVLKGITEYKKEDSYIFIRLSSLLRMQEHVIEAVKLESNNLLIIEEDKSIEEKDIQGIQSQLSEIINKKENFNKKIVLITKQDNALTNLFKKHHNNYQETTDNKNSFTDLTTASQEKLLQECKIIFQGREISLNKLIDENSKELIDSTTLHKLINNDNITIGHELQSLGDTQNYYIPRKFNYQTVIKTEIFKEEKVKYLLAISDIDEARLRTLVPKNHKISLFQEYGLDKVNDIRSIILNNGQAAEQFKQLCQRYPNRDIHWLKSESDQLIWQQSQGSISGLHQFIETDKNHTKYYSETELLSQTDQYKVMIISDTAGMGKTTVLTSLSQLFKQQTPELWIVRIDLNSFTKELQEQKVMDSFNTEDIGKAIAFLSNDILKLGTPLEQSIFKSYCKKMIVMFDAFDEISPDYREIVIDLVNVLRNSTIKQLWVTTRPNERDILEDKLQQLSYKLEPFSKDNQVNFMTKFWRQTSDLSEVTQEQQEQLTDYAGALKNLLTKSIRYKDTELTGIPLQTRMLAEAFKKDFAELFTAKEAKLQLPEKLDLTDLYEYFLKKKYDIKLDKSKLDTSQPNVKAYSEIEYSEFIEKHQNLALYTLFPEDKVERLLCEKFYQEFSKEYSNVAKEVLQDERIKNKLCEDKKQKLLSFINDIKTNTVTTGIIDQIIEDKPHFIHRTFAEYLVGKFLVANLDNEAIVEFVLQEILMQPAYQVTRAFFSGQLPESLPEDTLAQYGKQIERLWQSDKKNLYNKEGMTLLHIATEEGTVKIVRFFLNSLKGHETILQSLVEATTYYYEETALYLAAAGGYLDVVQCLVKHGADVNVESNFGSALHYAAQRNKWDVVQWLVEHGKANIEATDNYGRAVLHWAAQENKWEVVQWLVEHGKANVEARDIDGRTVLHWAAQKNKWDVVKWLVEHGKANVEATDNYGQTVLHWAAQKNKWDVIKWLVEHGKANVGATDIDGRTVLHWAAQKNKWDVVKWLVEHGKANIEATYNYGQTVLHSAARWGNLDVVQWLVEHGADVNVKSDNGETVLHSAARWGNLDVVQWLVEDRKANVEATNNDGQTVLHWAARGNLDIVQWLVEHKKANVEATDKLGQTVLGWAAQKNKWDVVKWLVEDGKANVEATDNYRMTVLHWAAKYKKWNVVKWLVEHGKANVEATDNYGQTVLHWAARSNLDIVQWLVEHKKANVEATDKLGQTVLGWAAQKNKWDVVKWLVEDGKANVEATDNYRMTVLHWAAKYKKWNVVKWLVEHGKANVEATDNYGQTVLHWAARGNLDIVQWLVKHKKANVEATDNDGQTVLHWAAKEEKWDVVKWLMEHEKANVEATDNDGMTVLHWVAKEKKWDVVKWLWYIALMLMLLTLMARLHYFS